MNEHQHCSECEGQKHHWMTDPEDIVGVDEAFITCKHCDLRVLMGEETTFIETSEGSHTFCFLCEGCGAEGILSVQAGRISDRVWCPDQCGATYILWNDPIKNQPALMCVIKPVFEEV